MRLFKTLFDIATLPVAIVKDVVTLGGVVTERRKTYTEEKIDDLDEDISS